MSTGRAVRERGAQRKQEEAHVAETERVHRLENEEQATALGGLSADEFKLAFRHHPAGTAVITADAGDGPVAMTATSVFSVSAEPPLFVFSISDQSSASTTITKAETLIVHLLSADQLDLAKLGATSGIDRFADTSLWHALPTGEPVFDGPRWIRAAIVSRVAAGTATLIVAEALETDLSPETGEGLVYVDRTWHRLGQHSKDE